MSIAVHFLMALSKSQYRCDSLKPSWLGLLAKGAVVSWLLLGIKYINHHTTRSLQRPPELVCGLVGGEGRGGTISYFIQTYYRSIINHQINQENPFFLYGFNSDWFIFRCLFRQNTPTKKKKRLLPPPPVF